MGYGMGALKNKLLKIQADLTISFDIDRIDPFDGLMAISVYRIVCEGCQNIVKHSNAKTIKSDNKKFRQPYKN